MARTPGTETSDQYELEEWEYQLLKLRPERQIDWLGVPLAHVPRHSRTRRYGLTTKQRRRDASLKHRGFWHEYAEDQLREEVDCRIHAVDVMTFGDHEQDLDVQHREELDNAYKGIGTCWIDGFLAEIQDRVIRGGELSDEDRATLDRIGMSVVDALRPVLADWEIELLMCPSLSGVDQTLTPAQYTVNLGYEEPYEDDSNQEEDIEPEDNIEDLMMPTHMKRCVREDVWGSDLPYLHKQDERTLPEFFGGWGYSIDAHNTRRTTRCRNRQVAPA